MKIIIIIFNNYILKNRTILIFAISSSKNNVSFKILLVKLVFKTMSKCDSSIQLNKKKIYFTNKYLDK